MKEREREREREREEVRIARGNEKAMKLSHPISKFGLKFQKSRLDAATQKNKTLKL